MQSIHFWITEKKVSSRVLFCGSSGHDEAETVLILLLKRMFQTLSLPFISISYLGKDAKRHVLSYFSLWGNKLIEKKERVPVWTPLSLTHSYWMTCYHIMISPSQYALYIVTYVCGHCTYICILDLSKKKNSSQLPIKWGKWKSPKIIFTLYMI